VEEASTCVGLDVHGESFDVIVGEAGAVGEVRHSGTIVGESIVGWSL
jgi:hypothetical protein